MWAGLLGRPGDPTHPNLHLTTATKYSNYIE